MSQPTQDPLVAQVFDAKKKEAELARAIEKLSPEQAAVFLHKLEIAIRKRKIQITGYLATMVVWLVGMTLALVYYGTHDGFVGWVFFLPFALVGATLYAFGHWAERVAKQPPGQVAIPSPGAGPAAPDSPDIPRAEVRKPP